MFVRGGKGVCMCLCMYVSMYACSRARVRCVVVVVVVCVCACVRGRGGDGVCARACVLCSEERGGSMRRETVLCCVCMCVLMTMFSNVAIHKILTEPSYTHRLTHTQASTPSSHS